MFSSKLRVAVGPVAAAALLVAGTGAAAVIQRPGGPTAPRPIATNPTMPKRVAVGVAFGGLEKEDTCSGYEAMLNEDLASYWNAHTETDRIAAKVDYQADLDEALNAGCFVQEL